MEHQDWTTVTFRRRNPKSDVNTCNPVNHEKIRMSKLANADIPGPKKSINSISIQALIRSRLEMKLTQEKADNLCAFPRNTFKNIESKTAIPTEEQKRRIQQHFNIYLKTITTE